jgi:hypothetical protein
MQPETPVAIAFPAYHKERFSTVADVADLRDVVLDTIEALGWRVNEDWDNPIVAHVGFSFWSFGERVEIRICRDRSLAITSTCVMPTQCFDWGKNEWNVAMFVKELLKRAVIGVPAEPSGPFEGDEAGSPGSRHIQESRDRIK